MITPSQCNYILAYLRAGNTLTPAIAYEKFGSLACHSRIAELRERGHNIPCTIRTRDGKRWGEYRLVCEAIPAKVVWEWERADEAAA